LGFKEKDYTDEELLCFFNRLDFGDEVYLFCLSPLGFHMVESKVKIIDLEVRVEGFEFNDYGYNEEHNIFVRPKNERTLNLYCEKIDDKFLKVLLEVKQRNERFEKTKKLMEFSFEELLENNIKDESIKDVLLEKYANNTKF
jgi:CRISPR/Cas system-associated endonuclease/helicase Cas3